MKLILTSAFFLTLIISVFGLMCWECRDMPDFKYRCVINENTGDFEMGILKYILSKRYKKYKKTLQNPQMHLKGA